MGVRLPSLCQQAVSSTTFQIHWKRPSGVHHLWSQSGRRWGGGEIKAYWGGSDFPFSPQSPRMCETPPYCLISSPRRQQTPHRLEPRDTAAASGSCGRGPPAFICSTQSWLICSSVDCSSLKLEEGARPPQLPPSLFSPTPTAREPSRSADMLMLISSEWLRSARGHEQHRTG